MCRITLMVVLLFWSVFGAIAHPESSQTTLPDNWDQWTPKEGQFQLYINTEGGPDSAYPKIDILNENGSWPFSLQFIEDTVYIFILPPGFEMKERSAIEQLSDEFPFVVWAGTERAVYWFSYDAGDVEIDTLQPALFITMMPVKPLLPDIVYLLLPGSGMHAKTIKQVIDRLKGMATLFQLDPGFYQGIWYRVSKTTIRRRKLNETAVGTDQTGTLLAFRLKDPAFYSDVQDILDEYR